jgi:AraC family transcriptional activator of pobA
LQKLQNDISVKNKLESEQLFKVSRFKETIKRTKPHKHDGYFEIIFLSEGAGFHWIDTKKYQITPPVIFFLSGQLHYWEMTSVPKGYVLLFREDFFNKLKHADLLQLVHALEKTPHIHLAADEKLDFIFEQMEQEYKHPRSGSVKLIQGYLQVVLVKLLRYVEEAESEMMVSETINLYRKFLQLVQHAHPVSNLKVHEIAKTLNTSPQHLNSVLKKRTGRSASELISEQVLLEAKRYLLHTDKTVSEIAFILNFSDPSHFVKYFKRSTGETPQNFRSMYIQ